MKKGLKWGSTKLIKTHNFPHSHYSAFDYLYTLIELKGRIRAKTVQKPGKYSARAWVSSICINCGTKTGMLIHQKTMWLWGKLHKNYYIIYIVLLNISNGYISHCGINWWVESIKIEGCGHLRFLANMKKFRCYLDVEIIVSYL